MTLPAESEPPPAPADFLEMLGRAAVQARSARLEALGLDLEATSNGPLGRRVVEILPERS